MKVKVSDLVARFLAEKEMAHVFGVIGSAIAHVFDSIHTLGKTQIVCTHHEQTATMAVQTYHRIRGKMTAAIVTAGGGSSNAITGVVSAWMDSVPALIISGNENSKFTRADNTLRIWGVQGFDCTEMVKGITKYAVRVTDPNRILYEFEKAYFIAGSGRMGPVWIDLPMNVQGAMVEESEIPHFSIETEGRAFLPAIEAAPALASDVAEVAKWIGQSKRPVFWLGNGVRYAGAAPLLPALLRKTGIPTLVTWAAIDTIDSNHPLVYGRAGLYGQRCANLVLQNADLVIAVGTRMPLQQVGYEITELARAAKMVVVDFDKQELDKYRERYQKPIQADAKQFIEALTGQFEKPSPTLAPWVAHCDEWKKTYTWVGPEHKETAGFVNSYRVMERLNAHFHPDQVVVTDSGTALLSGHQVLKIKPPQRLMTSLGLAEMGWGLPGAIGASFARDKGEVMCLNCDGGMMMNLQELQTVAHHRLPIKLIIFNNDGYLMIKHTQNALFKGRRVGVGVATGVSCPNYSALAAAFGFPAFQIYSWEDFDRVLPQVQEAQGPVICEVFMHPEQLLIPKLSVAVKPDGTLVSPPLEDLSPLLPREEMRKNMIVGMHPKSEGLS